MQLTDCVHEGPRNWTMDAMEVATVTEVRNLDGLDTRWAADIVIPEGADMSESEYAYKSMPVQCNRTWIFDKDGPLIKTSLRLSWMIPTVQPMSSSPTVR